MRETIFAHLAVSDELDESELFECLELDGGRCLGWRRDDLGILRPALAIPEQPNVQQGMRTHRLEEFLCLLP